jgi:hypothetical protein
LLADIDWYWIVRTDGQEGFVPSAFVYPAENILQTQESHNSSSNNAANNNNNNNNINLSNNMNTASSNANLLTLGNTQFNTSSNNTAFLNNSANNTQNPPQQQQQQHEDDLRYHGVELVVLYDYKAQAPDDLSVRRGEIIYADLNNQTVDGWLWCYKERKCGKYGFIPKSYTHSHTHSYNRQNTSV